MFVFYYLESFKGMLDIYFLLFSVLDIEVVGYVMGNSIYFFL